MRYGILGPLELSENGRTVEIAGAKQRALLAMLLLNANRVVSSDELVDAIWEEQVPDSALKALQVHVSQLRKLVGRHRLETRAPGYLLRVERDALDLEHFQRLYGEGELDEALSLWRGSPLAEFACHRFARVDGGPQRLHGAAGAGGRAGRSSHGTCAAGAASVPVDARPLPCRTSG